MTSALTRAKEWLVAPPDEPPPVPAEPTPSAPERPDDPAPDRPRRWLAPVASPHDVRGADRAGDVARGVDAAVASMLRSRSRVAADVAAWDGVAVLGEARDVPAVAAGIALALRRRRRAAAAVVALWPCDGDSAESSPLAAPAFPGARLLAGRLARRGLPARARGRLVWLPLGGDAPLPVPVDAPSVLAVMAPRDDAVDRIVARWGQAVVAAEPESPLAALAVAELASLGLGVRAIAPPAPGAARVAALAGLRPLRLDDDEVER